MGTYAYPNACMGPAYLLETTATDRHTQSGIMNLTGFMMCFEFTNMFEMKVLEKNQCY